MSEDLTPQPQPTQAPATAAQPATGGTPSPTEGTVNPNAQPYVEEDEIEEKEEKKNHVIRRTIFWTLVILIVIFLGTVVSSYLAGFDCVTDMYAWIWDQIR